MDRESILAELVKTPDLFDPNHTQPFCAKVAELERAISLLEQEGEDAASLRGEWLLVSALEHVRDPARLVHIYTEAAALLPGPSRVIGPEVPLHQTSSGVFGLVYTEPGKAQAAVEMFKTAARLYQQITRGGIGAEVLCQAEYTYYTGNLGEAEILAYRAAYMAREGKQEALLVDAAKLIAHIARHRCDGQSWQFALHILKSKGRGASRKDRRFIEAKKENARKELLFSLGYIPEGENLGHIPVGGDISGHHIMTLWNHLLFLFYSGQYERFLGGGELYLQIFREARIPLLEMYLLLFFGACHAALGQKNAGEERVAQGLSMAFGDGLYLVGAEMAPLLQGMVETYTREHCSEALPVIRRIRKGLVSRRDQLRESISQTSFVQALSTREREVAELAAKGMRNADIAGALEISEHTVKTHLKSIFSKLDVAQRYELRDKIKS